MNRNYKLIGLLPVFLLVIILISVIPSVSSGSEVINTFLIYEDVPEATSKTVIQGDYVNLVLIAYGHGEALEYEQLELVGSTLIFSEHVAGDQIEDYTWRYIKSPYVLNTGILVPGTYTLRFTARTATTQSTEYSDLQLIILPKEDTVKPVVDITNPTATTYTSHRTSLTFTVQDDNLQSCTYKLNNNAAVTMPSVSNGVNTITGISSVAGTNTWTVTCRDVAGNTGTDSVTFNVKLEDEEECEPCKDSKPLDDSDYSPTTGKITVIYEDPEELSVKDEPSLNKSKFLLMALILIIGVLILLILIAIIRVSRR